MDMGWIQRLFGLGGAASAELDSEFLMPDYEEYSALTVVPRKPL